MAARLETKTVFDSNRMETTLNSTVILNCQDSRYELIKDFSNGIAVKSEDGQLGAFGGIWNANTELNPFKTAAVEDPNE